MSTNHTPNYSLSQWEASDQVLRTDFNEDNAALEAALGFAFHRELILARTFPQSDQGMEIDVSTIPWSDYHLVVMRVVPGEYKSVTFTVTCSSSAHYSISFTGTLLASGSAGSYTNGNSLGMGSLDTCTHLVFFTHRAPLYRPWTLMFCYDGIRVTHLPTFNSIRYLHINGGPFPEGTKVQFWGIR